MPADCAEAWFERRGEVSRARFDRPSGRPRLVALAQLDEIILDRRLADDQERLCDPACDSAEGQQELDFIAVSLGRNVHRSAALALVLRYRVVRQFEIISHAKKTPP